MREEANNFSIYFVPGEAGNQVVKYIDQANLESTELRARLAREQTAYALLEASCPEIIPLVYHEDPDADATTTVVTEELVEINKVGLSEILGIIDRMQAAVPIPEAPDPFQAAKAGTLSVQEGHDYWLRLNDYLLYLNQEHGWAGLTDREMRHIREVSRGHVKAVEAFDTVFVHTDAQTKHFGRSYQTGSPVAKVYDFDQAHFGNELEDYTWLSVRHSEFAGKVRRHLELKFKDDVNKLEHLDEALGFFMTYFLAKGVYDRAYQPRGTAFDIAARAYGRLALASPSLRKATNFVISRLK